MKAFPKDIEVRSLKERHVGIENELGVPSKDTWVGMYGNIPANIRSQINELGILRDIGSDGGGREFRTNPIRIKSLKQVKGEKYLRLYYEHLKPITVPQTSGGTHLHISILDTDREDMEAHATAMAVAFFKQMQKIAGRETGWARIPVGSTLAEVKQDLSRWRLSSSTSSRIYERSMRMLGPTRYQTLEWRGPKGSNDCNEILAWVEFIEAVARVANRKSINGVAFKELVKGPRIAEYIANLPRDRKLLKKELEQKVDVNNLYATA